VDEYQDTQELQYLILSKISKSNDHLKIFLVGDPDQAIYQGLGGKAKKLEELKKYFGGNIVEKGLTGCFRSSQEMVDYYKNFQITDSFIKAVGKNASLHATICYDNTISKDDLSTRVAEIISQTIASGVPAKEICVVAPLWYLVYPFARKLKKLLPDLAFDAPGLSLLRRNKESIMFKVARLYLTTGDVRLYPTRIRWANQVIDELSQIHNITGMQKVTASNLLKIVNRSDSKEADGLAYLVEVIEAFFEILKIPVEQHTSLTALRESFFQGVKQRHTDDDFPRDVLSMRSLFKQKNGVVINTCHGLKGEEFDTVIGFGLLHGYVPNWRDIDKYNPTKGINESKKLLYVIASRAKNKLFLFAEKGRTTQGGKPYMPNLNLAEVKWDYD
jgi:superfamily I DNA/RNA helicase